MPAGQSRSPQAKPPVPPKAPGEDAAPVGTTLYWVSGKSGVASRVNARHLTAILSTSPPVLMLTPITADPAGQSTLVVPKLARPCELPVDGAIVPTLPGQVLSFTELQSSSIPLQSSISGMPGVHICVMPPTQVVTVRAHMPTPHLGEPRPASTSVLQSASTPLRRPVLGLPVLPVGYAGRA